MYYGSIVPCSDTLAPISYMLRWMDSTITRPYRRLQEFESALRERGDYRSLAEEDVQESCVAAHVSTNEKLHSSVFDDTLSGTTAISILFKVGAERKFHEIPSRNRAKRLSLCCDSISSLHI